MIGQPSQGFNFSFDVTVVSEIADTIINIHIIINIADRVYGQEQFAEREISKLASQVLDQMAERDEDIDMQYDDVLYDLK